MEISNGILIIGYGRHIENKILPVISRLKIPILGVVTSNKKIITEVRHFNSIKQVKQILRPSHVFIANNPEKHLQLIKEASLVSKNLMVEKPIHIGKSNDLLELFSHQNLIIKEAMMYKYNLLNTYLLRRRKLFDEFKKIELSFILPEPSTNQTSGFRFKINSKANIIYDIGCYIYDFLWSFKIYKHELNLIQVEKFDNGNPKFFILKTNNDISKEEIKINFGYGPKYINKVNIISKYDISYTLNPFFYGRENKVNIIVKSKNKLYNKGYLNNDCFKQMIEDWFLMKQNIYQEELTSKDRISFIQDSLFRLSQNWRTYA